MSNLLATPTPSAFQPAHAAGALALIVAAVALFAAVPALRAGRLNSVDALALGRASLSGGASRAARVAAALHLPATARLGVKDAFTSRTPRDADRRRADDDGDHARRRALDGGDLRPRDRRPGAARQAVGRARPARRRRRAAALQLVRDQPRRRARDDDHRLPGHDRRAARRSRPARSATASSASPTPSPTGACSPAPARRSRAAASTSALGLEIGDTVTLRAAGQPFEVTLVGRHVEPDNDGEIVIFPRATLPAGAGVGDGRRDRRLRPGHRRRRARHARPASATPSPPSSIERRGAPGARRHAPDRLRLERAAGRRRAREPAHDAAAGHPRAGPRLRDPEGDRADPARRARRRHLRRRGARR